MIHSMGIVRWQDMACQAVRELSLEDKAEVVVILANITLVSMDRKLFDTGYSSYYNLDHSCKASSILDQEMRADCSSESV